VPKPKFPSSELQGKFPIDLCYTKDGVVRILSMFQILSTFAFLAISLILLYCKSSVFRSRNNQGKCALCESKLDQMKKAVFTDEFYEIFVCKRCRQWAFIKAILPYWFAVLIGTTLLLLFSR
jgi:hypothetical protein